MSGSSGEPVWIPNYSTGLRLNDLQQKSSGTRGLRQPTTVRYQLPSSRVSRQSTSRNNAKRCDYIAAASAGISFDDDVVRERCFEIDPLSSPFTTSNLSQTRSSKRHRNDISYLNNPVHPIFYLKPVKPAKVSGVKSEHMVRSRTAKESEPETEPPDDELGRNSDDVNSLQMKQSCSDENIGVSSEQEDPTEWAECLATKLSAKTTRWLAQNPATTEDVRKRLNHILDSVHRAATSGEKVELVEVKLKQSENDMSAAKTSQKHRISQKDRPT